MYCVIIAGGVGKRFWPRSRKNSPKQLLNIVSDETMIKMTFNRLSKLTDKDKIYVVANKQLRNATLEALPDLKEENYIEEPSGKNTGPCIGLAAIIIANKNPEAVMGVFPADHMIEESEKFMSSVETGAIVAETHRALVTFGITPTSPSTGYGYIQYDKNKPLPKGEVYKVKAFAEKPNYSTAKRFVESGDFLWNSGMFIWKATSILEAMKNYIPNMYVSLENIKVSIGTPQYTSVLKKEWATIQSISIDYGVMEKANNVYVVKSDFEWNDVGSWDAVYNLKEKDSSGNVQNGNVLTIDSSNCLIHSEKRLIATIGIENLIIVETNDAILITKKGESEKVKDMFDLIKRSNSENLL